MDRQIDSMQDKQISRQLDRWAGREIDRQIDRQEDRKTNRKIDRQRAIVVCFNKKMHRQADKIQSDIQTDK